jgi:putative hydrolase of the HAD superfamily
MLPQAILFDLDDTLLEDDRVAEIAWEKTAAIIALETGLFRTDDFFAQINYHRQHSWSAAKRTSFETLGKVDYFHTRTIIVKKALDESGCRYQDNSVIDIVRTFAAMKLELTVFVPDAENTLQELADRGVACILVCNGEADEQRKKIEKLKLGRFFNTCLIEGELGHGKPDSRIFELALQKSGVDRKKVWMVGDRLDYDILGAQQSGIFAVWCDYGRKGLPPDTKVKPNRIINSIAELLTE